MKSDEYAVFEMALGAIQKNWKETLTVEALAMMEKAYAPYSEFPVGCAALTNWGGVVSGCNVENASYGLTLCAEATMVGELTMAGGGTLTHFVAVKADGEVTVPCGRCRNLLSEFAHPDLLIAMPNNETMTIDELLPHRGGAVDPKADLNKEN